ncbi:MAG TPA: PKD domain-containing protein [Bacteroidetes bacterium]|nr:PKD domain-containing protein [Bacteroidota bacterium]
MKKIYLLLSALFYLVPTLGAQNFPPIAYWQFESINPGRDVTSHGFDLNFNINNLVSSPGGQVGGYFDVPNTGFQPQLTTPMDDTITFDDFSMEFWFRPDKDFFQGRMLHWVGKADFYLSERSLTFRVRVEPGTWLRHTLSLSGTHLADNHTLLDGSWHHVAVSFAAKTGEQRIYLDGVSYPGFRKINGPSPPLSLGGSFLPALGVASVRPSVHLDEIAIYNVELPARLVWQHYNEGLNAQHYNTTLTYAGPLPQPGNNAQSGADPREFGPGYPAISQSTSTLLSGYPAPRYRPGHHLPRLIPWLSDPLKIANTDLNLTLPQFGRNAAQMMEILAKDYHYYLHLGISQYFYGLDILADSNKVGYHMVKMANANNGLPRFLINNWRQMRAAHLNSAFFNGPYINNQDLPNTYYGRNLSNVPFTIFNSKRWNWAAIANSNDLRLDSLDLDGLVARLYLDSLRNMLTVPYLDMVGENGEALIPFGDNRVNGDPEMGPDAASFANIPTYEATRSLQFRQRYSDHYLDFQDSVNANSGRDSVELYWYNTSGNRPFSHFQYDISRQINRFSDHRDRGGMYWYPQSPGRWRYGASVLTGLNQIILARTNEIAAGDQFFMPSVSPGFNDGYYRATDQGMIRPGQFLAMLKGMAMLGADGYALFMYHGVNASTMYSQGNWRAWKPAIPAYAQGLSSRMEDLLYNGHVLPGDSGILATGAGTLEPSFYTFSTGNQSDLVIGRRHNSLARFGLYAGLMRSSNSPGHAPRKSNICFRLRDSSTVIFNSMFIEARAQGSCYVLDLSGPDTVFYQLDGWHEWTDPWRWCRDFELEAELFDTASALTGIHTQTPATAQVGDYRDFTAFLRFSGNNQTAQYSFTTRHADQDSLRLWVRARSPLGNGALNISLNNGPPIGISSIGTAWQWHGLDLSNNPILLTNLGIATHTLVVSSSTSGLEIDKIFLSRSLNDFTQQGFAPQIAAIDSAVCLGDSVQFFIAGNTPDGCIDYTWDFGDGTKGYGPQPAHLYVYADTFTVTVNAWHRCLDSTRTDTFLITIDAPYVEAGQDTFMCAGDSVQLNGAGNFFFKWLENDIVSSPIIPNPVVWPDSSGYLHISGTDPLTGCSATDSVYVHVLGQEFTGIDQRVCHGATTELSTQGGYYVWWRPDPRLSSNVVAHPQVIANDTMSFVAYATNYCRCDTDTVTVTVFPYPPGNPLRAHDDDNIKICDGDSVQLLSTGYSIASWTPVAGPAINWIDDQTSLVPTIWPPNNTQNSTNILSTYHYVISGLDCSHQAQTDTVIVSVLQRPTLPLWKDTLYLCAGDTVWIVDSTNSFSPAITSVAWNTSLEMTDSTLIGTGIFAREPTNFTLSLSSFQTCFVDLPLAVFPVGIPVDTLRQCQGDSVALSAWTSTNIQWAPAQYFSDPTGKHPLVSVPNSMYVYASFSGLTCGLDSVWIQVRGPVEIVGPDTIRACAGDTVPLLAGGVSAALWHPGSLVDDSTALSTFHIFNLPTTIQVVSCDKLFCPGFDSAFITWKNVISADTLTLCYGDTLNVSIPGGGTCAWSPNLAISNVSACSVQLWPLQSGYYFVDHTDSLGCFARDSVWIFVDSVQNTGQLLSANLIVCLGDSVQLFATGATNYVWSPGFSLNDSTISAPIAGPLLPTLYSVSMTNSGTCFITDSVLVSIDSTFPAGSLAVSDSLVCMGDSITLTASGGTFYNWTAGPNGNFLNLANGPVQGAAPLATSTYYVRVSDGGVCRWRDSVDVVVDQSCCYVPGADYVLRNKTSSDLIALAGCFNPCGNLRVHVIDTFFVNGLMAFTNCEIFMDSMAVIWIEPGQSLNLDGCTVRAACPYMWDGIYIADSTASLNVNSGSVVSDGVNAAYSLHGGAIEVSNSTFRNNHVGIWMEAFAGTHSARVLGSHFTSNYSQMLPPYAARMGASGVVIEDVNAAVIGDPVWANVFDSLGNGVLALRSHVFLQNNRFEGIAPTLVHPKSAFSPANGCAVYAAGIRGFSPTSVFTLQVGLGSTERNVFDGNTQGVKVEHNIRLECQQNSFLNSGVRGLSALECHVDTLFVLGNDFENNWIGFRGTYNRKARIELRGNNFLGDALHPGIGAWVDDLSFTGLPDPGGLEMVGNFVDLYGIGLAGGDSPDLLVEANEVHIRGKHPNYSYGAGIIARGDSARITQNEVWGHAGLGVFMDGIRVNSSPEVLVSCNEIHNFFNDLRFWGASMGATVRKNTFTGGKRGIVLENNGNIGTQGAPGQPTENKWFPNGPGQGWTCGAGVFMAVTVNTFPTLDFVYVWNNQTQNPDHVANFGCNSGQAIPFFPTSGNAPLGCGPMTNGGGDTNGMAENLGEIAAESKTYSINPNEAKYLDEQMAFAMLEADSSLCQGDTLLQACHNRLKNTNVGAIQKGQAMLHCGMDSVACNMNSFAPQNVIEYNHQVVTDLLARFDHAGVLETKDSTVLDGIANQCALQGGKAVYQARTLMALLAPERVYLDLDCGSASEKKAEGDRLNLIVKKVHFHPNPAQNKLWIDADANVQLEMYDLKGQKLYVGFHLKGSSVLETEGFPRGVYLIAYRFSSGGGGTQRIILH